MPGVNADMVGKWERGEKKPSPFYREKLCILYTTTADKLGLIGGAIETATLNKALAEHPLSGLLQPIMNASMLPQVVTGIPQRGIFIEEQTSAEMLESQLLSLSSKQLATLIAAGWSEQDILTILPVLLQGEAIMAKINRRQVLQLGAGLLLSNVPLPVSEHPSAEERMQLSEAIGQSVAASWTLIQNASTAQVLAVSQAQLALLQQAHHTLYPNVRPMHYSAVYRLIGASFHFMERYDEARRAHEKSYIAALEGADLWNMAQSLVWQADGFKAQKHHADALEPLEKALRLLSEQSGIEARRLQAHILASSAENAAHLKDTRTTQAHLERSQLLLKDLPAHEEFDTASWYQHAGACALILEQYDEAITHLQQALNELPPHWTLRHAITLIPLCLAYTGKRERDESLAIAEKTIPVITAINSPSLSRQFVEYLQQEMSEAFPTDQRVRSFLADVQQKVLPITANSLAH